MLTENAIRSAPVGPKSYKLFDVSGTHYGAHRLETLSREAGPSGGNSARATQYGYERWPILFSQLSTAQ
jgi:hypothetical protein